MVCVCGGVCVCVSAGRRCGAPVPPLDVLVGVGTAESGVGKWCVCVCGGGGGVCASVLEGGVGAPVPPLDVLVGVGTAESGVGKWCVCVWGGVCVSAGRRCWCSCASSGCVGGCRDS